MNSLIDIRKELLNAFDSFESFEKYYKRNLKDVTRESWRRSLRNKLSEIYNYLISESIPGPLDPSTVQFWYNVVKILKSDIEVILFRLGNDVQWCIKHREIPEVVLGIDRIRSDEQKTGKTYRQLEAGYLDEIDNRIIFLQTFQLYCADSSKLITALYTKTKMQFQPIELMQEVSKEKTQIKGVKIGGVTKNTKSKVFKSFGFLEDHKTMLKGLYTLPLDNGDFIDQIKTSKDTFVQLLTSKDFNTVEGDIYFGCETTQVAYIVKRLAFYSNDFTLANIGISERFYSKQGSLIKAGNLYAQKSKQKEPKGKSLIDNFFKNLP